MRLSLRTGDDGCGVGRGGCVWVASRCSALPESATPTSKNIRNKGYFGRLLRLLICGFSVRFRGGSPLSQFSAINNFPSVARATADRNRTRRPRCGEPASQRVAPRLEDDSQTRPHEIDRDIEGVVGVRVGGILAPTAMEIADLRHRTVQRRPRTRLPGTRGAPLPDARALGGRDPRSDSAGLAPCV
jgi:hypothetical protein